MLFLISSLYDFFTIFEKVEIKNGDVTVFNDTNPEGITINDSYVVYKKYDNYSVQLGEDEYFVMGDNRAGSSDSRAWGPVPKKYIIGRPIMRLIPLNKMEVFPGI